MEKPKLCVESLHSLLPSKQTAKPETNLSERAAGQKKNDDSCHDGDTFDDKKAHHTIDEMVVFAARGRCKRK